MCILYTINLHVVKELRTLRIDYQSGTTDQNISPFQMKGSWKFKRMKRCILYLSLIILHFSGYAQPAVEINAEADHP